LVPGLYDVGPAISGLSIVVLHCGVGDAESRAFGRAGAPYGFHEKNHIPIITGRLLADLHPNGTVRIVFIASVGGGNECPLAAGSLDAAEIDFVNKCGLTPERASALRTELERNKGVSVQTSIDGAIAAKFRYARQ